MNLVTLEGVSKQYSERQLLDEVNLLINQGDRIGLIGVNGSGKTTLLRLIAGQESPDAGSVTVWGGVRIQFLPQNPRLDENQTVLDSLFESTEPRLRLLRQYERASRALQARPNDADLQARLAALADEMTRTGGWAAEANAKAVLTRLGITNHLSTPPYFFLPAMAFAGPLRVRALVWVRWPRTGRLRRWRRPR